MMFGPENIASNGTARLSLRLKSYIVYGTLIVGAAAVTAFVFYQKHYLFEQFDEMQTAYDEETRLREVDLSILRTIHTQIISLENVDIEHGSSHAKKHLKFLHDFFEKVVTRHINKSADVSELSGVLHKAYESPTRKNLGLVRDNLNKFRGKLERHLEVSREYRETLAVDFRERTDLVGIIALVLGLIGFTILGVINALFFTRLTNDVQSLKKRAQNIANGNREEQIPVTRHDEVGELIDSINQMAGELDEHEKNLEIERQKYFQQEKMAAIGVLAAGIAHEVGNPIAAISALLEELKQTYNENMNTLNEENIQKIDMLLEQTERLKTITREVSTFARPQLSERELLDLNGLIRSACKLMRYDKRWKKINLELELDSNIPAIYGVPDQLTQVIMNLLVNASDTLEDVDDRAPKVNISTTLDEDENSVYMVVQDNGNGMDHETMRHALEAFYTTKEAGKGTGLGLSLCHSIITEHGGEIYVDSTSGVGTAVRIFLPLVSKDNQEVSV